MPFTPNVPHPTEIAAHAHAVPEVEALDGQGHWFRVVYKYQPGGAFWRCDVLAMTPEEARDAVAYSQRQDGDPATVFAVIPMASVI